MYFHIACNCGASIEAVARPGMCCPRCGRELVAPAQSPVGVSTDETTGFTVSEKPSRRNEVQLVRQITGLTTNTARAVKQLEDRLTPAEQEQIRLAVERGQAVPTTTTKTLEETLHDLERATVIIGIAMLREPPR